MNDKLIEKTILVIDDEDIIRSNIAESLRFDYLTVLEARDGVDGYNQFTNHSIDLIISDINMPNMNGWELCQKIRAVNLDIPIILISGHFDTDEPICVDNSIQIIHLIKPIPRKKFKETIARALAVE